MVPTGAVYCATKFAVGAISEGLRQEVGGDIRVTVISPGVTESELADSITDSDAKQGMREFRKIDKDVLKHDDNLFDKKGKLIYEGDIISAHEGIEVYVEHKEIFWKWLEQFELEEKDLLIVGNKFETRGKMLEVILV